MPLLNGNLLFFHKLRPGFIPYPNVSPRHRATGNQEETQNHVPHFELLNDRNLWDTTIAANNQMTPWGIKRVRGARLGSLKLQVLRKFNNPKKTTVMTAITP